jgi:CubicO group peptidase (beta-lactamase class C family)
MNPLPDPSSAILSNWRTPPFSSWAFQHVPSLLPTVAIAALPGGALPLPVRPRSLDAFNLVVGDMRLGLDRFLAETMTDGLVILLDGELVYEFYANGMKAETAHIVMSASKSIVGLVAGILSHAGRLDLAAPVSYLVPEIARTGYRGATLRQLLDMRTGVRLDDAALRAYGAASNLDPVTPAEEAVNLHSFLAQMGEAADPHGGPFRYVSANTDLLGWAIERATGQTFAALVSELLWKPMGATHDAYITVDRAGAPRCTGGMGATARDFARIGQLMVDGGRCGDRDILPATWIDDIACNGDAQAWKEGEFAAGFAGMTMRYRGGWYVIDDQPQTLFAMGIHGQNLFVDRANRVVIAKLSCHAERIDYRAVGLTHRAVPEFRRCLLGAVDRAVGSI